KYNRNRDDTRERPRPETHELRAASKEPHLPEVDMCRLYGGRSADRCVTRLSPSVTTSVSFADFVPSDLVYRDRKGQTYRVKYNPMHRWFYSPRCGVDEAILIKCYDSAQDDPRFTAHSAFENPTAPKDVLPRESFELRTLAFHTA